MSLQYIATLNGPMVVRKPPQLMGFFTPFAAHPILLLAGIFGGLLLAKRRRR